MKEMVVTNPLSNLTIDYQITSIPNVLYAALHPAIEIPEFESFIIPDSLKSSIIECRFIIYDNEGKYIDFSSQLCPANSFTLTKLVNIIPLKMINNYLDNI
jgi:hypothetical protein